MALSDFLGHIYYEASLLLEPVNHPVHAMIQFGCAHEAEQCFLHMWAIFGSGNVPITRQSHHQYAKHVQVAHEDQLVPIAVEEAQIPLCPYSLID